MLHVLTALARSHGRFLLHAAGAHLDGRTVLALGGTGAGKSTFAAGALHAGWDLLGDDLVSLTHNGSAVTAHGVIRPPMLPAELGVAGTPVSHGNRQRTLLPSSALDTRGHGVTDVVLLAHSPGEADLVALPGAAALRSLMSAHLAFDPRLSPPGLAVAAALCRGRVHRLSHAADPERRLSAVAAQLARLLDEPVPGQGAEEG